MFGLQDNCHGTEYQHCTQVVVGQAIICILQPAGDRTSQREQGLLCNQTIFCHQAADLICLRSALRLQFCTDSAALVELRTINSHGAGKCTVQLLNYDGLSFPCSLARRGCN